MELLPIYELKYISEILTAAECFVAFFSRTKLTCQQAERRPICGYIIKAQTLL